MTVRHLVAVDLGASSGRVILARHDLHSQSITLKEVSRCVNQLISVDNHQCWNLDALEDFIVAALETLDRQGIRVDSIGIDTWGVDYVLLDEQGERVGLQIAYRDDRTHGVMAEAARELGHENIYQRTGIQFLPFNTLYQLRALCRDNQPELSRVAHALLIPDYLHFRLTGKLNWEYTNATTTQLLNIRSGEWDRDLLNWTGANPAWFGQPSQPGRKVGHWHSPSGQAIPVIAVATHDTASAVLAAPLADAQAAYLSSGTWSLMGFESREPFTSRAAQAANITNEGGAEGRYRVLKNIMGLWLLQRVCDELAIDDLCQLIADAERQPVCQWLINPNDDRFLNPASMVREIQDACAEQAMLVPATPAELARCIFDSLALYYREVLQQLERLRGRAFSQLHIVGGGCQNQFLNQLCANACGIPVYAGPVEASTLGNIGCQLIAAGDVADVSAFRQLINHNFPLIRFDFQGSEAFRRSQARFQALTHSDKELCI
ncbi:rhamnulokinase [Erwinia sp. S43]|uniref:rhamnulokinase n=1 Tax=Erwinia sp. S43 TaxID=2769339 RepID=UPI00190AE19A|nr:rhamnulokinase [Erwinia sp. S43]MBK0031043.1 rhamnulokinase [Erwinia sp. S43]